jgi:phosphoenolpyruvate synthase/pyruvate phosphate dikinase
MNRSILHKVTIFDQFGWLGESYWNPIMEDILTRKIGLIKNSTVYHKVMFTLTKPERISTTLEEKRAVIKATLDIKDGNIDQKQASNFLAKDFGWMPIFIFGLPWDNKRYEKEINELLKRDRSILEKEYLELVNYTQNRNNEIKNLVEKYNISKEDLQKFIDFGLTLDARNEAEYVVSFAGPHLMYLYKEISKRLNISIDELRKLYEYEIPLCLERKMSVRGILENRRSIIGFGYDEKMEKRVNFNEEESRMLFEHCEKNVKNVQGEIEHKGVCASPGKVEGRVKIVHSPAENNKVEEGDVLITHATTVDYLPAMKKAVAIVTEVGGLTCHAAVVSREFKIPCVVALKNAMKNFKDGDLVEVDANKGVVRIINAI